MGDMQLKFSNPILTEALTKFYTVPDYQRGYVWGDKEIEQLLSDLTDAFNADEDRDYFVGSMVVCRGLEDDYEIVDGQQRMTTFFLIVCAIKDRVKAQGDQETLGIFNPLIKMTRLRNGKPESRYHLKLQFEDTQDSLERIAESSLPVDSDSFDPNARSLAEAANCISAYLAANYPDYGSLISFASFVLNHVVFVSIQTLDMGEALRIFETVNERGVGLNAMDLLKNTVFQQVRRDDYEKLNELWREATDALVDGDRTTLKEDHPLRFLRYYLMATYDVEVRGKTGGKRRILREDDIYSWVKANPEICGYESEPFRFVEGMRDGAKLYMHYLNDKDSKPGDSNVRNILCLGGSSYKLHLMLLLAAKNMDEDALARWKAVLESIVYYTSVNRINTNETEPRFTEWCPMLRKVRTLDQADAFINKTVLPVVDGWRANHRANFSALGMDTMRQYRVKFILSRIAGFVRSARSGNQYADSADVRDIYEKTSNGKSYEIEHIAPQKHPQDGMFGLDGQEYDQLISKIGNLTLLEKSINASVKDADFSTKREAYATSDLYLTRSISRIDDVGSDTAVNRVNKLLRCWETWSPTTIRERQDMLCNLGEHVWGNVLAPAQ